MFFCFSNDVHLGWKVQGTFKSNLSFILKNIDTYFTHLPVAKVLSTDFKRKLFSQKAPSKMSNRVLSIPPVLMFSVAHWTIRRPANFEK